MPTVKRSGNPSKTSKTPSKRKSQTSELGNALVASLRETAAHLRGEAQLRTYEYHIPDKVDVRALRRKTGLSQAEFAARYAFNRRTLQEWEQGRAEPDLAVRAYLTVIDRQRDAVEEALARAV